MAGGFGLYWKGAVEGCAKVVVIKSAEDVEMSKSPFLCVFLATAIPLMSPSFQLAPCDVTQGQDSQLNDSARPWPLVLFTGTLQMRGTSHKASFGIRKLKPNIFAEDCKQRVKYDADCRLIEGLYFFQWDS